jgi:hypothetical protein
MDRPPMDRPPMHNEPGSPSWIHPGAAAAASRQAAGGSTQTGDHSAPTYSHSAPTTRKSRRPVIACLGLVTLVIGVVIGAGWGIDHMYASDRYGRNTGFNPVLKWSSDDGVDADPAARRTGHRNLSVGLSNDSNLPGMVPVTITRLGVAVVPYDVIGDCKVTPGHPTVECPLGPGSDFSWLFPASTIHFIVAPDDPSVFSVCIGLGPHGKPDKCYAIGTDSGS